MVHGNGVLTIVNIPVTINKSETEDSSRESNCILFFQHSLLTIKCRYGGMTET